MSSLTEAEDLSDTKVETQRQLSGIAEIQCNFHYIVRNLLGWLNKSQLTTHARGTDSLETFLKAFLQMNVNQLFLLKVVTLDMLFKTIILSPSFNPWKTVTVEFITSKPADLCFSLIPCFHYTRQLSQLWYRIGLPPQTQECTFNLCTFNLGHVSTGSAFIRPLIIFDLKVDSMVSKLININSAQL